MFSTLRHTAMSVVLAAGCSTPSAPLNDRADAHARTVNDAGESIDLSAIAARTLDSLTDVEAVAVCEADARRLDPCQVNGVATTQTPADCAKSVTECRRARGDAGVKDGCTGVTLGPPGSCLVSVGLYLQCIDDWKSQEQCENAGYALRTPASCTDVVTKCPRLASRFTQDGKHRPCDPGSVRPIHNGDDIYGLDCRPTPARMVVLGDSIAGCLGAGSGCAPTLIANRVRESVAPNLLFESHAEAGAVLHDLLAQAQKVAPGPGHVLVWIFAVGNDMTSGPILTPNTDLAPFKNSLDVVFQYFDDAARFPDGATFLLNGQYSIYDGCDPSALSLEQQAQVVNKALFFDTAVVRSDTTAIDHFPDWLGHAGYANVQGCPYCGTDNQSWIGFGPHPNSLGGEHIAAKWFVALDGMYASTCSRDR